ncbi:MAG: universal stress protein [Alphaproteobacteria bacterium]|nr:universal stress protein [Alphaproteobacteria bacterium]MBF0250101.1 universal stress protein [Alphaproteobacteria bacterium]
MIHLAYDGSVNGDWVAWYALNLAKSDPELRLRVVSVDAGECSATEVRAKAETLSRACEDAGVTMSLDLVPSAGANSTAVFRALVENVPAGPDTLLVCGARLKEGDRGYLSGTVSEKLLKDKSFPVMAVRVVQPGLLGAPHRFLVPVAGDREGLHMGERILARFGAVVQRVHLLRVMMTRRNMFRRLLNNDVTRLRDKGRELMGGLGDELARVAGIDPWKVDVHVTVSDDWAHDVIIAANRHKAHMILMEASRKDLHRKFLYGNPIEIVLRNAPCDVAIYRGG